MKTVSVFIPKKSEVTDEQLTRLWIALGRPVVMNSGKVEYKDDDVVYDTRERRTRQ